MAPPWIGKIHDRAGSCRRKQSKSIADDRQLLGAIEGFPERMPERPANRDRPRDTQLFGHVTEQRNGHRRDPGGFDRTLNQSNGLMAEPSGRSEECEIRLLMLEFRD